MCLYIYKFTYVRVLMTLQEYDPGVYSHIRIHVHIFIYMYAYIHVYVHTAQEWKNCTADGTNGSIRRFLVLLGSGSTMTEITEYTCFSLL